MALHGYFNCPLLSPFDLAAAFSPEVGTDAIPLAQVSGSYSFHLRPARNMVLNFLLWWNKTEFHIVFSFLLFLVTFVTHTKHLFYKSISYIPWILFLVSLYNDSCLLYLKKKSIQKPISILLVYFTGKYMQGENLKLPSILPPLSLFPSLPPSFFLLCFLLLIFPIFFILLSPFPLFLFFHLWFTAQLNESLCQRSSSHCLQFHILLHSIPASSLFQLT